MKFNSPEWRRRLIAESKRMKDWSFKGWLLLDGQIVNAWDSGEWVDPLPPGAIKL